MFWMIRKSISWGLTLFGFAFLLVLVLPGDYRRDVSILIRADRARVYSQVRRLGQWNALAMFSDLTRKRETVPEDIEGFARGSRLAAWLGGAREREERPADSYSGYLPQIRVTEARYPALLVYRIDGGPLPGVEPRVIIEEAPSRDWKAVTRVTIREEYRFTGFWAGIKALSARFAADKLHRRNLNKLRELCEDQPPAVAADDENDGNADRGENSDRTGNGIPLISGDEAGRSANEVQATGTAAAQKLESEIADLKNELQRVRAELGRLAPPPASDPRRVIRPRPATAN